ncbi:MAG TPA: thiolase family protein [Gaiellaceae bacterium]|nr:thiolase family protein [Gaiellaceae bacterium]
MARGNTEALVLDAVRSPIGRRNGTLAHIRGDELSAQVLNGMLGRLGVEPGEVEDVQWGCVTQVGEQAWNVGRNVALTAGWPISVCGTSVDRQCGSSMQTNLNAAAAVWSGQLDLVVSGGVEMMSRVPMGSNDGSFSPLVHEQHEIVMQGISAEELARRWNLSRERLDRIGYESQMRAARAIDEGRFEREIVPVEVDVPDEGSGSATVTRARLAVDEAVRRDTTLEKMAQLQPAFVPDGVVTAGNSSAIVDGAAAVLVASERKAAELGLEPRARFVSFGLAGVDPHLMLHGNPEASAKALAKAGLTWDDIDVIEVNEAFASVVAQFVDDAGLSERYEAGDVNPNGGGISLGHPLGATGARITATLVSELERRHARYGLATMCIGFGQAIAAVVERV